MRKRNKKKLLFSLGMSICVSLGLLVLVCVNVGAVEVIVGDQQNPSRLSHHSICRNSRKTCPPKDKKRIL